MASDQRANESGRQAGQRLHRHRQAEDAAGLLRPPRNQRPRRPRGSDGDDVCRGTSRDQTWSRRREIDAQLAVLREQVGSRLFGRELQSPPPMTIFPRPPATFRIDPSSPLLPAGPAWASTRPASRLNGSDCSHTLPGPVSVAKSNPSPPNSVFLIPPVKPMS